MTIGLFLAGASVVVEAVGSEVVGRKWGEPSVLEEQTVGSLAGHVARGGIWVVQDYLGVGSPAGPVDFESAGQYFAHFADHASAADHQAIRDRGAAVAAEGQAAVAAKARASLEALRDSLPVAGPDRLVSVIASQVMRLEDYLATRIVEQVVHLDDLGRSVGAEWAMPEASVTLVLEVGVDVGVRRRGSAAMTRALYRHGFADVLPVL
jgi:Mycothiol maleylpyruvate isomerase N-terminal domain